MLAVGSKPGGPFARVDKGTYTVTDTASNNRHEDTTADAYCCEAEAHADSQDGTDSKGDEPDANEARGRETVKPTLATPATPAGAGSAALAPRAGGRPRQHGAAG